MIARGFTAIPDLDDTGAFVRFLVGILGGWVAFAMVVANATAAPAPTPTIIQEEVKAILSQEGVSTSRLAVVPTILPAHFRYEGFSVVADPPKLELTYADQRSVSKQDSRAAHEVTFESVFTPRGNRTCGEGAKGMLQVGGKRVYSGPVAGVEYVWVCLTGGPREITLSARGSLPVKELALLVAYARRAT